MINIIIQNQALGYAAYKKIIPDRHYIHYTISTKRQHFILTGSNHHLLKIRVNLFNLTTKQRINIGIKLYLG